jgi:hypothetical protein
MFGDVSEETSLLRIVPSLRRTSLDWGSRDRRCSEQVRIINGQSLFRTEIIYSVSFFYFPILSVIIESESLSRLTSFLLSYLSAFIFSIRFLSRSFISLDLNVDKFSMIEL